MVLDPTWGNATEDKIFVYNDRPGPFDVSAGAAILMDVYIPQDYVTDGNLNFNIHIIDFAGIYDWVGSQNIEWPITGDAFNTIGFNIEQTADYGASGFDTTEVAQIGLEILANGKPTSVDGNFEIDNVMIIPASEQPDDINVPVDSGWRTNPTLTMSYEAGGVMATTTANNDQLAYDFTSFANLAYALVTIEYTVDQAFIDSGANLQPFGQLKSGGWPGAWCWVGNGSLTTAMATSYCTLNNKELVDGESAGFQLGMQRNGGTGSGSVTVNSVTVSPVFE